MAKNYFELFDIPPAFNIDNAKLESNFRKVQSASHPDRFVTATSSEKMQSMQLATLANEAYQTLKKPANRAQYLLEQQGITAIAETNTAMPADFLMQQMEWRETMEDAVAGRDIAALEVLLREISQEAHHLCSALSQQIDERQDYAAATTNTRKLIFIDKVCADIHKAIEKLDD